MNNLNPHEHNTLNLFYQIFIKNNANPPIPKSNNSINNLTNSKNVYINDETIYLENSLEYLFQEKKKLYI